MPIGIRNDSAIKQRRDPRNFQHAGFDPSVIRLHREGVIPPAQPHTGFPSSPNPGTRLESPTCPGDPKVSNSPRDAHLSRSADRGQGLGPRVNTVSHGNGTEPVTAESMSVRSVRQSRWIESDVIAN